VWGVRRLLDISRLTGARDTSYSGTLTYQCVGRCPWDTNNPVTDLGSNGASPGYPRRSPAGPIPLGWRRENGRRVEEPLEQRVLAVIRQAVDDEDYSFGAVADLLNRFALTTKRGLRWTAGTVRATYLLDAGRRLRQERDSLVERVQRGTP
jgi:hypothetical protein